MSPETTNFQVIFSQENPEGRVFYTSDNLIIDNSEPTIETSPVDLNNKLQAVSNEARETAASGAQIALVAALSTAVIGAALANRKSK